MFREPFDTIPGAIELHDRTTRCAAARRSASTAITREREDEVDAPPKNPA